VCKHIGDVRDGAATVQQADMFMNWVRVELLGGTRDSSSSSSSSSSCSSSGASYSMDGFNQPVAADTLPSAMYKLCLNYQLALQVVVGFVLPCMVMYCSEAVARYQWYAHHCQQQQQRQQQQQ
jgi:hypothetical protein